MKAHASSCKPDPIVSIGRRFERRTLRTGSTRQLPRKSTWMKKFLAAVLQQAAVGQDSAHSNKSVSNKLCKNNELITNTESSPATTKFLASNFSDSTTLRMWTGDVFEMRLKFTQKKGTP